MAEPTALVVSVSGVGPAAPGGPVSVPPLSTGVCDSAMGPCDGAGSRPDGPAATSDQ
ncbi:hypothetical protein [Streptomyces sp. LN704]|uniref:hypothetical protein n=1 Tax=unclassified Streptomyces TaxID=2593676 RepID=UPI00371C9C87